MSEKSHKKLRKWAHLRFSIVGPLLARPPEKGELAREFEELASRRYPHPNHEGKQLRFGASTIERWYYQALGSDDPIKALSRKIRSDAGRRKAIDGESSKVLHNQYLLYPDWSYKLHADNLAAYLREQKQPGPYPSYASVLRLMKAMGWLRKPRPGNAGQKRAAERLEKREVRSFEAAYIHQLWHLDFHHGRMRVTDSKGDHHTPKAL
ncbi:MAG: IS481 family transposase, partial [Syntrophobacteraceae bacterium]|nr:IS481 family transposase [Syntrophobacteraceae bacterium]